MRNQGQRVPLYCVYCPKLGDRTQPTEAQGDDALGDGVDILGCKADEMFSEVETAVDEVEALTRKLRGTIEKCVVQVVNECADSLAKKHRDHAAELATLKASHADEINELKSALASERDYVNTQLTVAKASQQAEIEAWKKRAYDAARSIAALNAAHLAELAKVRLEEAHNCKPVECRLPAHIPFKWPACSACQSMARWEERIAILEAAK